MAGNLAEGGERIGKRESIPERGSNVVGAAIFIRHGVRTKTGALMEEGRVRTAEVVQAEALRTGSILSILPDKVRVIGSDAGPKNPITDEPRSLDSAHIAGDVLANVAVQNEHVFDGQAHASSLLSYETLMTPMDKVYDHEGAYNTAYDAAIERGLDVHDAAQEAQDAAMNAAFAAEGILADQMRKEMAGAFAVLLVEFIDKLKNAKNGTSVLMPAGTHGGVMEYLLQQTLVWTDADGNIHGPGFKDIRDIGGAFSASESYAVQAGTDLHGNFGELEVTFQDRVRRTGLFNAHLDYPKLMDVARFYRSLHKDVPTSGLENVQF